MSAFEYRVIDIDKVGISDENFLNKMDSDDWELFFINNEPQHEYPRTLVKFYFRRKRLTFLEKFFDF